MKVNRKNLSVRGRMCILLTATASALSVAEMVLNPTMALAAAADETSAQNEPGQLQEITVTARKREENVRDVPAAITVISAATADPGQKFEAYTRIGYEFKSEQPYLEAMVSGPLNDVFSARLAIHGSAIDSGYVENVAPSQTYTYTDVITGRTTVVPESPAQKYGPGGGVYHRPAGLDYLLSGANAALSARTRFRTSSARRREASLG